MNRQEKIAKAYGRSAKHHNYREEFKLPFFRRMAFKYAWNIKEDNYDISHKDEILSWIDDDFAGKMLEVPCANGLNTLPYYKKRTKGTFIALDYTQAMLDLAVENAKKFDVKNVTYVQGDVGNLQFNDEEFDIVFSWMGFHVFPDKEAAFKETHRVLKKGGEFMGCFYVKGITKRTDWFVKNIFEREGIYTGPYETLDSLKQRLESMYSKVEIKNYNSIALFKCVK